MTPTDQLTWLRFPRHRITDVLFVRVRQRRWIALDSQEIMPPAPLRLRRTPVRDEFLRHQIDPVLWSLWMQQLGARSNPSWYLVLLVSVAAH